MNAAVNLANPADTNHGIFLEAAERLRICSAAESDNRSRGIEALQFRWGNQWDDDIRNTRKIDGRPALTINLTNTFCARLENQLRQQRPRIAVHPTGDGATIDTAKVVSGLIRHVEDRSKASVAYDWGVQSAIGPGWGYWRIISEYLDEKSFDQELLIQGIRNPFTVYFDPSSVMPDGRDAMWVIISGKMKRAEYKRRYPKADNADWRYTDAPGDLDLDWESREDIRLAEYYRIYEVRDVLCRMSDGSVKYRSELPTDEVLAAMGEAYQIAKDDKGKPLTRPTTRRQVEWYRLNGREVVEERALPGRHIPVIRCEGNVQDINGDIKRKGMVEDLKDPAQMYNYWRTAQTERYALAPKAPWVAAEGQIEGHPEWNNANQKSYSVLVYKPVMSDSGEMLPPPQRQAPTQVEAGMTEAAQGAEHDLTNVAGMPQENPEIAARVVSGNKYLQRRQGMQDMTHFQYYDNQTMSIAWTGELLLELFPHYYDTERVQRIVGADGKPQMITLNQQVTEGDGDNAVTRVLNDMSVGRYQVVMDTGPGYATQREEASEGMVELLNTPLGEVIVHTGADIVLRNMDFHGADELADRAAATIPGAMDETIKQLPQQAQTIIGALQQQLQQKEQVIQQQTLEIKYKAGVENQRIHGQLEQTDRTNENRIHVQSMKDATSRDVAEIHGATQLLNTSAEAGHDRAAARALIDAGVKDRTP